MNKVKMYQIASLLLAFCFLFSCKNKVKAGAIAPDFVLSDLDNRLVSLKEYRGKFVLLDFWATWCYACRMSIPELIRLQRKYKEKGFCILSISLDSPYYVSNEDLIKFKKMLGINYLILRGNMKVVEDYFGDEKPAIPTMFLIDRDGRIREKIVGFDPVALRKAMERYLK
jgi:peroxiredoxin